LKNTIRVVRSIPKKKTYHKGSQKYSKEEKYTIGVVRSIPKKKDRQYNDQN
jgi:hypothetical protein